MESIARPLVVFALVAGLMPLAARAGLALGFAAEAGERDVHEAPTPRVGGLVVFAVALPFGTFHAPLYAAFALLLAAGAWDDRFGMRAWVKAAVQVVAACLLVLWGGARIEGLGDLFGAGEVLLGPLSAPLSIFCVVLLINAMNMADGLDGLAAGYGLIACAFMAPFGWVPAGALVGFLVWSLRTPWRGRAAVFLGDAGSMALGLLLAWAAILAPSTGLAPVAIAWILALPVMDAAAVMARRVAGGGSPLAADRGHLHHRLMDAGLSHGWSVAVLLTASAALGLIGLLPLPAWALAAAWAALCLAHVGLSLGTKAR